MMCNNQSRTRRRMTAIAMGALAAWLSVLSCAEQAWAIPVFARKYRTSCITCHAGFPKLNSVGEAFRRNGYQFPRDEELLVKDEPIPMGNEAYKEMWPYSIWPSDLPHLPPVAFRARMGFHQFLNTPAGEPSTDFRFPMDYNLMSAGTFGEDISWYAGMVLAGKGGHGGGGGHGAAEETGLEPELERLFVQFSNLLAWSPYDDDDGMRMGHRWVTLPPFALNLRIGQFEPQVIAPWASIHRQLGITGRLPNVVAVGDSSFRFEPALRGFEVHGILAQYNSYAFGVVNGNGTMTAWDNNTDVDIYFRFARKWFGYPLDGVLGEAPQSDNGNGETDQGDDGGGDASMPPGLDFWREISFETGAFGYFGRNRISLRHEEETAAIFSDRFNRLGFDSRLQWQDFDLFGAWIWAWDGTPGGEVEDGDVELFDSVSMFTWFVEADYVFRPWLTAYARYEQASFDHHHLQEHNSINRAVVGTVFTVRANMRVVTEFLIDARGPNGEGERTTNDTFQAMLDFAY